MVGAAYFFFEATTVLNMTIFLTALTVLPRDIRFIHIIGNLNVLTIAFIILSMFAFSLPALGIAWVCRRRVSASVTSVLVIGWLVIYVFLLVFYPPAETL